MIDTKSGAFVVHATNEGAHRARLEYEACEGVPTEALERLAEAGGVRKLIQRAKESQRQVPKSWANMGVLLERIGPLEGNDE